MRRRGRSRRRRGRGQFPPRALRLPRGKRHPAVEARLGLRDADPIDWPPGRAIKVVDLPERQLPPVVVQPSRSRLCARAEIADLQAVLPTAGQIGPRLVRIDRLCRRRRGGGAGAAPVFAGTMLPPDATAAGGTGVSPVFSGTMLPPEEAAVRGGEEGAARSRAGPTAAFSAGSSPARSSSAVRQCSQRCNFSLHLGHSFRAPLVVVSPHRRARAGRVDKHQVAALLAHRRLNRRREIVRRPQSSPRGGSKKQSLPYSNL